MATLQRAGTDDLAHVETLLDANDLPTEDISSGTTAFFVECMNDEPIGIGGLERYGKHALLRSVVIEASSRGEGHGTALCEQLLMHAARRGVTGVYLLTTTAADFFETLGFEEIDRERAPPAIRATREFTDLCPSAAVCLRMALDSSAVQRR